MALLRSIALTLSIVPFAGDSMAGEWDLSGAIVPEMRMYLEGPRYGEPANPSLLALQQVIQKFRPDFILPFTGQDSETAWPSIAFYPTLTYEWNGGDDRIVVSPFARLAYNNDRRTHADLREGYWLHVQENWDLLFGFSRVFWGVTESRHLVDIINQDDQVEDIDQDEKLGQPMVNVNFFGDWGRFGIYYLPYFRERTFPSNNARLRGPLPIDTDNAIYESNLRQWHPDVALRYDNTWQNVDIGLSFFHGTSREPKFVQQLQYNGLFNVPSYDIMTQFGLDGLIVEGNWLWKVEAILRYGQGSPFFATVAGFEYTVPDVLGSGLDFGILGEYIYDGRDEDAPPVFFDNDVFVGTRLTFNDSQDTNILAGATIDVDSQATFLNIEASRRLGQNWGLEVDARLFLNVPESDTPLYFISDDSFVQGRIARYF